MLKIFMCAIFFGLLMRVFFILVCNFGLLNFVIKVNKKYCTSIGISIHKTVKYP